MPKKIDQRPLGPISPGGHCVFTSRRTYNAHFHEIFISSTPPLPKIAAPGARRCTNKWRDEGKANLHPFAFRLHPFSRSPYLRSRFEHHVELAKLLVLGQQISPQARGEAGVFDPCLVLNNNRSLPPAPVKLWLTPASLTPFVANYVAARRLLYLIGKHMKNPLERSISVAPALTAPPYYPSDLPWRPLF